jgi:E3 ubiquitin-protein ligase NEDD4
MNGLFNLGRLILHTVVAADGLSKRDVFRLPDPFAVITVDGEQTHTTGVIKKTLNPYWSETFDMSALFRLTLLGAAHIDS